MAMKYTNVYGFNKQSGVALFVGLILLVVLLIIGVTAVRNSTFQEQMAANVHRANYTFSVAESGVSSLIEMANNGNELDPNHILFRARMAGTQTFCVDANGNEGVCGSDFIDGGAAQAQVSVMVFSCRPIFCTGYSQGTEDGRIRCQTYQVDSTGSGFDVTERVQLWAIQLTAWCVE
jgi:hypothetical protein